MDCDHRSICPGSSPLRPLEQGLVEDTTASTSRTLRSRSLLNPPNQSCESDSSQLLHLFTLSLDPEWPQVGASLGTFVG